MIRIGGNPTEGTPTSINIHKNEGRVGINMDPSGFMFDVNGSFNCSTLSIGGQLFTGGGGIDDDLTVNNTLSVTGTTDLNGNVGIGTSASSSHTLDVNGTMSVGEITMNGHMIPSSNAAYDFGSAEYKIRHLFLSDNSLWIGDDTKLSVDSTSGGFKVRKRKKNTIPKKLQGHVDETALTNWDNSISSVEDMTLAHWNRYIRENPAIRSSTSIHNTGDLYDDDDDDFESEELSSLLMDSYPVDADKPMFFLKKNGTQTIGNDAHRSSRTITSWSHMVGDKQLGSNYINLSTGKFTAPVDGYYQFNAIVQTQEQHWNSHTVTGKNVKLRAGGYTITSGSWHTTATSAHQHGHQSWYDTISTIIALNSGQEVYLFLDGFRWNFGSDRKLYIHNSSTFSGFLVHPY
jgi:hypothetical protein